MNFKSLTWIFVFLISISFISALNVTIPSSSAKVNTSFTATWVQDSVIGNYSGSYLSLQNASSLGSTCNGMTSASSSFYFDVSKSDGIIFYGFNFKSQRNSTKVLTISVNGVLNQTIASKTYTNNTNFYVNLTPINLNYGDRVYIDSVDGQFFCTYGASNYVDSDYIIRYNGMLIRNETDTQTFINFTGKDRFITNQLYILNSSGVLNLSLGSTSSNTSNINLLSYNLNTGLYYFNVTEYSKNGIYNSTRSLFNLTNNALLNVTALNFYGGSISTFNISVKDNVTGLINNYTTTSGKISLDVIYGRYYNVSIFPLGYISSLSMINISSRTTLSSFTVYPDASLFITMYDELTGFIINQSVNITVTDITNPYVVLGTTSNGTSLIQLLPVNDVLELKFVSVNYSSGRNYRVVLPGTYNSMSVYLLPKSSSQNMSICFYDQNGVPIYNLNVFQWYLSNVSYVLTQDVLSDISGKTFWVFNTGHYYYYNISSDIYSNSPFILNPPQNSAVFADGCNYDVTLKFKDVFNYFYGPNVTATASFNNISDILTLDYVSGNSSYSVYYMNVSTTLNGQEVVICSDSSAAMVDSLTCDLFGYHDLVRVRAYADGELFFGGLIQLDPSTKLFDNLDTEDAAYWSGFIMLIIVFGGIFFGLLGTMIAGVVGLFAIFWLGLLTPITLTLIIVDIVVVGVINFGLKRWA